MHNQDSLLPRREPPSPTPPWKMNGGTNPYPSIDLDPDPENDPISRPTKPQRRFKSSFAHRHIAKGNAEVMEIIRQAEARYQPPTQADLHTVQPITHHCQDRQATPFHSPMHAFSPLLSKGLAHDKPDNAHHQTPKPTPIPSYGGSRFKSSFAYRHKDQRNAKVMDSIGQPEATPAPHQPRAPTRADLHTARPITHHYQGKQQPTPSPSHLPKHTHLPSNSPAPENLLNARHQNPKPTPIPRYDGSRGLVMKSDHSKGGEYTRPQTQEDPEDIPVHASYFRRKRELKTRISKNFNEEEQGAFEHMVQVAMSNSLEASYNTAEANNPKLDEEQDETGYYQEGTDDPASSYHSTYFTARSFNSDGKNDASGYASSVAGDDSKASASSYHYPVRKHEPPLPLKPQQVKITQNPNTGKHTPSSNRKEQLDVDFPNHRQIDIPERKQCVDSSEFIISLASPPQPGQKYGIIIVTSSEGEEVLGATGDEDAKKGSRDEQWEMVHPVRLGLDCSGYVTHGDEIGDGRGEDVLDTGARKAAYDAFEASRRLLLNFVRRPW